MAEQLELTTPVVETTDQYRVVELTMNENMVRAFEPVTEPIPPPPETPPTPVPIPGVVIITIKDNNGEMISREFIGTLAQDMIKFINTGDFSTRSLHRRILELLSSSGVLPGAVVGTPELPSAPTGLE